MIKIKLFIIAIAFFWQSTYAHANNLIEELNKPGTHLILRHALAPGTGDPDGFQIDECSTQRNLNDEGRLQAKKIGDFLKNNGVSFEYVLSSQWCRCLETASLIDMGEVQELQALNSSWTSSQYTKDRRTAELKSFFNQHGKKTNMLLVTHYINILELTGKTTGSGEGLVLRTINDDISVIGYFELIE